MAFNFDNSVEDMGPVTRKVAYKARSLLSNLQSLLYCSWQIIPVPLEAGRQE